MKKQLLILSLVLFSNLLFAQAPIAKGESQLNAGVGLSSWGVPLYVGLDYGVHEDITIGGELSYRSYNDKYANVNYDHSVIGISGNGNYHFNRVLELPSEWDFYAGLNLGFYIWNSPNGYEGSHSSGLGLGAQIGGRYFFSDNVGVNLEFGGGNAFSGGKLGVTFRL
ncbi:outer membrane beta-barrel protein [Sunxiuqinia elliptica]|uniref:Outer membrane protein beta-barrel domain-containing protein n=1 Tax=Sunxiuqinia elliptica TaxID=655355 RepID=A0A1I2IFM5_9BACT|nr:outer membrane beta-barrel protein [Sunxiuqinia elliptica]TDN97101.1 outer membrane protein with beta-barrel domain [Sunxiuqinia elliptica]TDO60714.1 outer membrane protein with beta-barrel domain [Sunxiuqinia elliptica]SFF41105.1 Outer membrane protein beta-barrel domain-containing protein [Sunxiuqinia elliptica]